jgi:hypothetical protein
VHAQPREIVGFRTLALPIVAAWRD